MTGAERDGLIQLTREARQPGWWHSFRDVLPNPYEVYIGLEAGAASIRNFEPVVVPGLLQTADYAREIFRNGPRELEREDVERRVEVRLARQEILARVAVRDSKKPGGPKLLVSREAWRAFLLALRAFANPATAARAARTRREAQDQIPPRGQT